MRIIEIQVTVIPEYFDVLSVNFSEAYGLNFLVTIHSLNVKWKGT
jgi:hypothetical protein